MQRLAKPYSLHGLRGFESHRFRQGNGKDSLAVCLTVPEGKSEGHKTKAAKHTKKGRQV